MSGEPSNVEMVSSQLQFFKITSVKNTANIQAIQFYCNLSVIFCSPAVHGQQHSYLYHLYLAEHSHHGL